MIKIEISKTIKDMHRYYFDKNIVINLNNIIDEDIYLEINDETVNKYITDNNMNIKDIETAHIGFIKKCEDEYKDLAVGNLEKLNKFIKDVNEKYKIIQMMINAESNVTINGDAYYKYIYDLFGYESFKEFNKTQFKKNNFSYENFSKLNIIERFLEYNTGLKKSTIEDMVDLIVDRWNFDPNHLNRVRDILPFWGAYAFIFLLNVRVCPYCNRNYIAPVLHPNGKSRGDLDHFYPKKKYPYLSLSIYNLIPCCGSCNSSFKGIKEFNEDDIHPYKDSFDDKVKFTIDYKSTTISKIGIKKVDETDNSVDNFINYFRLEEQYVYHTNIVDELRKKKIIYSKSYIEDIKKIFKAANLNNEKSEKEIEKEINEIIIGYPSKQKNINNEPLSKLRRDLVELLELDIFQKRVNQNLLNDLKEVYKKRTENK